MRSLLLLALAVSLGPIACSSAGSDVSIRPGSAGPSGGAETPSADGPPPALDTVPCRFALPKSLEGTRFACADLVVPEDRSKPAGNKVRLHLVTFRGRPGGVPTIELQGGPGAASEGLALALVSGNEEAKVHYAKILEQGDLVLLDQRGTGRSEPRLSCAEEEANARSYTQVITKCRERYEGRGIDLREYDAVASAEDVHDLVTAMKVPQVNLHGISYGTRLELEVLRRHPKDVRAAIIDGVLPAQVKALSEGNVNIDAVIKKTFAACAADAKCRDAYPDLDAALGKLKTKLETTPFQTPDSPYDWWAFASELGQNLYADGYAAQLPYRITSLLAMSQAAFDAERAKERAAYEAEDKARAERAKSDPVLGEIEARIAADKDFEDVMGMAEGMYLSVVCSDYVQYESVDEALALDASVRPELRDPERARGAFEDCKLWPAREKRADVFAAVASDRPVLAIGGAFDPATPVRWAELATKTLSKSQLVVMQAGAHGAVDACGASVKAAFLAGPDAAVDGSCGATQTIAFAYPNDPPPKFHRGGGRAVTDLASAILAQRGRARGAPVHRRSRSSR